MRLMCFDSREAHVLERLSAVGRLVHAVAPRRALPVVRLRRCRPTRGQGCVCDTATSPIDMKPLILKSGVNVAPLLVVFQTPPCAVPTYQIAGFFS